MSQTQNSTLPAVCRCLRTKAFYGPVAGEEPWQLGTSSVAQYWCLRTMEPVGPDENFAHPHTCSASGRRCYAAGEET
jgi:hypothetical protein